MPTKIEEKVPFFSHDYYSRGHPKIVRMRMDWGWESYAFFWAIVEKLHESKTGWLPFHVKSICFEFGVPDKVDMIQSIIMDYGLFFFDDEEQSTEFTSSRVYENKKVKNSSSLKAIVSGAKGNLIQNRGYKESDLKGLSDEEIIELFNKEFPKNKPEINKATPKNDSPKRGANGGANGEANGGRTPADAKERKGKEKKGNILPSLGAENSDDEILKDILGFGLKIETREGSCFTVPEKWIRKWHTEAPEGIGVVDAIDLLNGRPKGKKPKEGKPDPENGLWKYCDIAITGIFTEHTNSDYKPTARAPSNGYKNTPHNAFNQKLKQDQNDGYQEYAKELLGTCRLKGN